MSNTCLELLKAHQAATDATDAQMLEILCDFMDTQFGGDNPSDTWNHLWDHVVENLECPPGEVPASVEPWRLPMFTEGDRETMIMSIMDVINFRERAKDALDQSDLIDAIGYACSQDAGDLAHMLIHIQREGYVTGEFLRDHGEEEDEYPDMLDFAVRMGLLNDDETEVTERGTEFIERWSY